MPPGSEVRDVIDLDGGLSYFRVEDRELKSVPRGSDEPRLASYPNWSPDGKYLYYCSAPFLWTDRDQCPPERYEQVKYDLMRIGYDVQADRWGEPETVLSAAETGLSILLPRISPDGRFLVFCMCRYGCFPVFQPSSDLYLLDLAGGDYRKLDINSDFSESYHSWSSNSRWIAFSSRRQGGVFTRCYFSYVDRRAVPTSRSCFPSGTRRSTIRCSRVICVPELVTGPVRVSGVGPGPRRTVAGHRHEAASVRRNAVRSANGRTVSANGAMMQGDWWCNRTRQSRSDLVNIAVGFNPR